MVTKAESNEILTQTKGLLNKNENINDEGKESGDDPISYTLNFFDCNKTRVLFQKLLDVGAKLNEEAQKFIRDKPLKFAKHLAFTKKIFINNVSDFYKYYLTPETYIQ